MYPARCSFVDFVHNLCELCGKKTGTLFLAGIFLMLSGQVNAQKVITLESLLDEMVSVEEMAGYPVLRLYFDGATEPQWVIPAYDMMQLGITGPGRRSKK